jgi:hypothetical protein
MAETTASMAETTSIGASTVPDIADTTPMVSLVCEMKSTSERALSVLRSYSKERTRLCVEADGLQKELVLTWSILIRVGDFRTSWIRGTADIVQFYNPVMEEMADLVKLLREEGSVREEERNTYVPRVGIL